MKKTLLSCSIFALFLTGCVDASSTNTSTNNIKPVAPVAAMTANTAIVTGLPDFTTLVEKEGKAVVNISTTQIIRRQNPMFGQGDDPFDIFRRFGFPVPPRGQGQIQPREERAQSLGSGFIIENDGYIVTNAHVIAEADEITVKLSDKREFKAKVIGSDARTDIALLKIDAKELPTVDIGSSDKLKVGEWVIAIGSPFGLESTVTAGIVSAKSRDLPDENYVRMIQTDAAVNPGNSGGPLFNVRGEVVGVNSQIYSRSGGYMGLSFAIPIDDAMQVINQLKDKGKVTRGRIAVNIQEITEDIASALGRNNTQGALISSVEPDGPAAKAGIQNGDIILKFNGKPVEKSTDLPRIVSGNKPGSTVPVEIWRDRNSKVVNVTIAEMEQAADGRSAIREYRGKQTQENALNKSGLTVTELDQRSLRQLNLKFALQVRDVDGPAAQAGIQPGDLIVGIGGEELKSFKHLEDALAKAKPGQSLALRLLSNTQNGPISRFVALKMPSKAETQ